MTRSHLLVLLWLVVGLPVGADGLLAQTTAEANSDEARAAEASAAADAKAADAKAANDNPVADDKAGEAERKQQAEIMDWIDQLGSTEFAVRERAASQLASLGPAVIPQLRKVSREADDPEIRLRALQIVSKLAEGDMQARIDAFLAGKDVDLPNWDILSNFLGDTLGTRELYVDLITDYPGLVEALSLELRDRVMAKDAVMAKIQNQTFVEREFASKADLFALVLAISDPQTPFNASYESLILNTLNQKAASEIQRDPQLSGPFNFLLSHWIARSTLTNRGDVLRLTMRENLDIGLELAERTLTETTDIDALATAMQTISKFGSPNDSELLEPFLDDKRKAAEPTFAQVDAEEIQLGDVAMAALAILNDIPLEEIGLTDVQTHPADSFTIEDVGFPESKPETRSEAREKLQTLLKQKREAS